MNFKGKMQRKSGITLIALTITIIVLLILAGVAITAISRDNGILQNAARAKEETEQAERDEKEKLGDMEDILNEYTTGQTVEQVTDEKAGVLEGTGTDDDPYVINSIEDLVVFASNVRKGTTYEGQTVKLGLSLDFKSNKSYVNPLRTDYGEYGYDGELKTLLTSGEGFIPIGSSSTQENNFFYGTFDGNNYDIYNLYVGLDINQNEDIILGFFAVNYGTIKNLNLKNVNIDIPNVKNNITVGVGGVTAMNRNSIADCYVSGNIINKGNLYSMAGGICGVLDSEATIENCINESNILVENNSGPVAGGIVGQSSANTGIINASCNTGTIQANGKENAEINVGGIIGYSRGEVKNCYNTGNINGKSNKDAKIGGIVGAAEQNKNVSYCYNTGEIKSEGSTSNLNQGGIIGWNYENSISNVFNFGNINVQVQPMDEIKKDKFKAGGIAAGTLSYTIENAYNIGDVIENIEAESIGSIVGQRWDSTLSNCNYLKGTYSKGIGILYTSSDTEEGVTELEDISDFPDILDVINEEGMFKEDTNNINNGYPVLNWQ